MGKKSRLKRERRTEQSNLLKRMIGERDAGLHEFDSDFQRHGSQLCDLFAQYNAEDVAVALGVSDLWLPNISSQVKHHFAVGVLAAMGVERFTPSNRLVTYDDFCNFIQAVYTALPSFPSLEDFIPEPDWGEIRVGCGDAFLNIFYGSSVERIPDFIEAFRLRHEGQIAALADMNLVIALQDKVISSVRREVIGTADNIDSGHLETPSEAFWLQCRVALLSACDVMSTSINKICPALVLELGSFKRPVTWSSFGDAVMSGTSLPGVMLCVEGKLLPISIRNAASVVIDFWANKTRSATQDVDLLRSVANFISQRLEDRSVIGGPLQLTSRKVRLTHRFAAIVQTAQKFHFIAVVDAESLSMLEEIERDILNLLASGEEWGVVFEGRRGVGQFLKQDGTQPVAADIAILAVLSKVSTSWMHLQLPKTTARVMSFPDLVTVFDSLEDADELDRFWAYVDSHESILSPMLGGYADLFGSFRDCNALLVEGALMPDMISLDPHWGCTWRFKVLTEFWAVAPPLFPDDTLAWKVEPKSDGLQRLINKKQTTLAWCTTVDSCTIHVVLQSLDQPLDLHNSRLLELFVHCLADGLSQRRAILEGYPLFRRSRIVLVCHACDTALANEMDDERTEQNARKPLLSGWLLTSEREASSLSVTVEVNLARLQYRLDSPSDAIFEAECVSDATSGMSSIVGLALNSALESRLLATSSGKPRFTLKRVARTVDVPDFTTADVPTLEQYKIARRDLAVVLKNQGVEPGRYELAQAKEIIDAARDALRAQIHKQIAAFDRKALLLFCIEQHDALTAEYRRDFFRVTQSMEHEVSYDRSEALAEAHDSFTRDARNYLYLLECCVSASSSGTVPPSAREVLQLIAAIDWLLVLYFASDVLHNDIDVAGVELDHSFIPQVFYSENREKNEREFALEMANAKLGIDFIQKDEVLSAQEGGDWQALDQAFIADLGFSFTQLNQMLLVLAQWKSVSGEGELRLSYQASKDTIAVMLKTSIQDLTEDEANRLVDFAILDPAQIRRLLGKTFDESDVPVWEYYKRGHRYTIRPLIAIGDAVLAWGACAANRAAHIWTKSISNGYLPADFDWPHVRNVVREIKAGIELQLEVRAFEVCSRATPWLQQGIDFKRKFPKEQFEDVGDFDVLAYWPTTNQWLSVECKYNQPPFCLKDARRLRERIFGSGLDRGQFTKIERRRGFLTSQTDRLRKLLGWPEPSKGTSPTIDEIYVSRDIYWWMRNPPFIVPTHFVRIDALDRWLRSQGLLLTHSTHKD